eukprot:TRINITY_DN62506_c0_g1_i1.p1 TRINITY_DN62506_c0_g1~~TRINITY_DN62506_c0_g1_i1.p1  ORF type:complete len:163 (-),score=16.80 TRINITY_DN62506_c0_g1_i1:603-1091(-)
MLTVTTPCPTYFGHQMKYEPSRDGVMYLQMEALVPVYGGAYSMWMPIGEFKADTGVNDDICITAAKLASYGSHPTGKVAGVSGMGGHQAVREFTPLFCRAILPDGSVSREALLEVFEACSEEDDGLLGGPALNRLKIGVDCRTNQFYQYAHVRGRGRRFLRQ